MSDFDSTKLLVFDVDGTLLMNGPIVKNCFYKAFENVVGSEPVQKNITFMGMTDKGIVRQLVNLNKIGGNFEQIFRDFASEFELILKDVYPHATDPYLLPGVDELLETLSDQESVKLALGTGNIRNTCRIKLGKFDLNRYFPVGGYGGDFEARADVIDAAISNSREYYHIDPLPQNIWVIGDTPEDVKAGKANNTRTLAVASGFVDKATLDQTDADFVLEDLSDIDEIRRILEV